ncbi:XPA domain containing protein [Aphelenchoides bicaudatus]|nr:XPA domain containing protein [Aphelenchoides bicaudatus]
MAKRRGGFSVPIVEKLYKKKQDDYTSAGGFDVGDDEIEERRAKLAELAQQKRDREAHVSQQPEWCIDCKKVLIPSYLWETFNHPVCDICHKENPENYKTMSRTRAKADYLLKDEDLDARKPILRYISRKNPHNPRYGDMKLYLELQVRERAMQLHGSVNQMENTREIRRERKDAMTAKKYENKIKKMRKEVRSGIKIESSIHEHEFDEEKYNSKKDVYWQTCTTCGFVNEYEKL